jgi:hypothetical protein
LRHTPSPSLPLPGVEGRSAGVEVREVERRVVEREDTTVTGTPRGVGAASLLSLSLSPPASPEGVGRGGLPSGLSPAARLAFAASILAMACA